MTETMFNRQSQFGKSRNSKQENRQCLQKTSNKAHSHTPQKKYQLAVMTFCWSHVIIGRLMPKNNFRCGPNIENSFFLLSTLIYLFILVRIFVFVLLFFFHLSSYRSMFSLCFRTKTLFLQSTSTHTKKNQLARDKNVSGATKIKYILLQSSGDALTMSSAHIILLQDLLPNGVDCVQKIWEIWI